MQISRSLAAFQDDLLETLSRHALTTWPQCINPEEQEKKPPHNFKAYKQALIILLIKKSESFPLKSPLFGVTYIHLSGCNLVFNGRTLPAVSLKLTISIFRLLPLWKKCWCPLQPRCLATLSCGDVGGQLHVWSPAAGRQPRRWALLRRAGAQGRLVPLLSKSCCPLEFWTTLPAKPHPHPITSPACHPSA